MKLIKKENLIEKIGMKFDEAVDLFSGETLLSMSMGSIVGGGNNTYCNNAQCASGCNNNCSSGCSNNGTGNPPIPWTQIITAVTTIVTAIIK